MDNDQDIHQTVVVKANNEFTIIIDPTEKNNITIKLQLGNAEIFGVDMLPQKIYTFSSSFTVLTRSGCTLKLGGNPNYTYASPVNNHLIDDVHASLEEHRTKAEENDTKGPITLITGPMDAGKSTLTRTLLNYAVRCKRKPLYFDLDVGQSSISIPGTMSVLPITWPEDLGLGFNDSDLSVYFFGSASPGMNIALYYLLIQKLGQSLSFRMKESKRVKHSGAVIDTCGWVEGQGYKFILAAARFFEVNRLLVLSDDILCSNLKKDLPSDIEIKLIPSLKGVVKRNKTDRRERRESLVHEYFYGVSQRKFHPYTITLKFSDVQVVEVIATQVKVLFENMDEVRDSIRAVSVPLSRSLINQILAVSHASNLNDAMLESVMGFICVLSVDMENGVLTALAPQPNVLNKGIFILGNIQFYP